MSSAIGTLDKVEDVDEALRHLSLVPTNERGAAWHAYLNAVLEQRSRTGATLTAKETE